MVTDETILAGFANLHQAMATGFDTLRAGLGAEITGLESRMLRRFDAVDVRLDRIEGRLDRIEGRLDRLEPLVNDHGRRIGRLEAPPAG